MQLYPFIAPDSKICYVITNNLSSSYDDVRKTFAIQWRVEEYHRGLKQTTGIENCQAQIKRSQRTHIFCSLLSFLALEKKRLEEGITWYESKRRIIADALFLYLKQPIITLPGKEINNRSRLIYYGKISSDVIFVVKQGYFLIENA